MDESLKRWNNFLQEHPKPFCWWCGRRQRDKPEWWHAGFLVERAHIVNKPRKKDRRAAVLLCSLCHRLSHGDRFRHSVAQRGPTLAEMLRLKWEYDHKYYDRKFLQSCWIGRLPNRARQYRK